MNIDGRFNIDVLFHDRDGTNATNVLSLTESDRYTTGSVILVSRTASVGSVFIPTDQYRDAAGALVSVTPSVMAFVHSGNCIVSQTDDADGYALRVFPQPGKAVVVPLSADYPIRVQSISAGSYTAVIYGE